MEVGDQVKVINANHVYAGNVGSVESIVDGKVAVDVTLPSGEQASESFFEDELSLDLEAEVVPGREDEDEELDDGVEADEPDTPVEGTGHTSSF